MSKLRPVLLIPLLALTAVGAAQEPLPDEMTHQPLSPREEMPDNFQPMNDRELSRTRGVVSAPARLSAPDNEHKEDYQGTELFRQQRADQAALIVELDSRIDETARALSGAAEDQRPALEQRYHNLQTLREGF